MSGGDVRNVLSLVSTALRWATVPVGLVWFWVLMAIVRGPISPDPATGRVVPVPNHGHDVYVTALQSELLHWLIPGGIVLVIVGNLTTMVAGKLKRENKN